MIDVRLRVQQALDKALHPLGVLSFWQRKENSAGEEYIVYTISSNTPTMHADNVCLYSTAEIIVLFYYPKGMLDSGKGKARVDACETAIQAAMRGWGFTVLSGPEDAGDFGDIGKLASAMLFSFGGG